MCEDFVVSGREVAGGVRVEDGGVFFVAIVVSAVGQVAESIKCWRVNVVMGSLV